MPVGPSRFHEGQRVGVYTVTHVEPGGVVLSSTTQREDAVTGAGRQFVDFWTIRLFRELGLGARDMRLGGQRVEERREVARVTGLPTTFLTNSSRHAAVYEYLEADPQPTPVVLIIDEINRADLSRVFGELITLLEFDKRQGASEARSVTLTYSGKPFSVPAHLSVLGTMNTADKSLSTVDLALRRRFEFILIEPEPELTPQAYAGVNVRQLFAVLNRRLAALNGPENLVGHADYMEGKLEELRVREGYADTTEGRLQALAHTLRYKTVPFLVDLFRADWSQVRAVAGKDLFDIDDLSDLADMLDDLGHNESISLVRPAEWWNPQGAIWNASLFSSHLPVAH